MGKIQWSTKNKKIHSGHLETTTNLPIHTFARCSTHQKWEQEMLTDFTSSALWSIDGLPVGLEINFCSEDTSLLEYFVVLSLPEVPPVEEGKGLGSCAVPWSDDSCRGQAQELLTCSVNSSLPVWGQEGSPLEIGTSASRLLPSSTAVNITPCQAPQGCFWSGIPCCGRARSPAAHVISPPLFPTAALFF